MKLNYGTKTVAVDISGVAPEFGGMRNINPHAGGRFINPTDMAEQRRVLFIGWKLAEQVFGKTDPVGKTVMLKGSPFLIVGVLRGEDPAVELQRPRQRKGLHPGHDVPRADGQRSGSTT